MPLYEWREKCRRVRKEGVILIKGVTIKLCVKISTNRDDNAHLLRIVVTLVPIKHKRTKCDHQNDNLAKLWQDNLPLLELIAQISVAVEK